VHVHAIGPPHNHFFILVQVSAHSNPLRHMSRKPKCVLNKTICNKQQKGGELICGVSYLIFWNESRARALARMDFKPTRRPGPRPICTTKREVKTQRLCFGISRVYDVDVPSKCFSLKLHDKLRSPLSEKHAWNFRKPYRQRSCSRGPDHR
jgi:hypothetical protein